MLSTASIMRFSSAFASKSLLSLRPRAQIPAKRFYSKLDLNDPGKQQINREKWADQVIVELCIVPSGAGIVSLSPYVAQVEKILRKNKKLNVLLHPNGTDIEGPYDEVMASVRECHDTLHRAMGVPRIMTVMRIGTRVDKPQKMQDKMNSVQEKLKILEEEPGPCGI